MDWTRPMGRRVGLPFGLPYAPTSVSSECDSKTDFFSCEIQRLSEYITDAFISLHWLTRVPQRIQYKLAVMMLHRGALRYLGLYPRR